MKAFRLFAAVLFVAAFFAVSAYAQAPTTPKFAVIDTGAFGDSKAGITKYINGLNTIKKEFDPVNTELQAMGTRYEALRKEIETLREQASKPNSPIAPASVQTKIDEYGKMGRDIQFKQEDAKARSQTRWSVVMGPVMQDIAKAIQDYAKQKGYTLIFDAVKLDETGLVLGIGDDKIDVTKDFITFYNARPAGTASVTNP